MIWTLLSLEKVKTINRHRFKVIEGNIRKMLRSIYFHSEVAGDEPLIVCKVIGEAETLIPSDVP